MDIIKKFKLICCCLILFSTSLFNLANAKTLIYSCDGCSSAAMKSKAETTALMTQGTAHVFNEKNRIYKKYSLSVDFIEDLIPIINAREVAQDASIRSQFYRLVDARTADKSFFNNRTFDLGNGLLTISSEFSVSYQPINLIDMGVTNELASHELNSSEDVCVAKPVASSDNTAHNYITSSQLRRELFFKLDKMVEASHPSGGAVTAAMEYSDFISVIQNSSNGIIQTFGDVLSFLDVSRMTLNTADGGTMKGRMDYKKKLLK